MRSLLINLSGRPGSFSCGDVIQEYFYRLLEAVVERKGVEFGAHFIRNVISRNLHHFARIKLDLRVGIGLAERSSHHKTPHTRPEVQTLLETYRTTELHRCRPGRSYNDNDTDNWRRGLETLWNGRLAKWISDTVNTRGLNSVRSSASAGPNIMDIDTRDECDDDDVDEDEEALSISQGVTVGTRHMLNGELVTDTIDLDEVDDIMEDIEREDEEEGDGEEEQ